jgi:hypothetical protein
MKDYIYIPPSSRTAKKHLKPALRGVSLLERRGICFWRRRFHVAWFDLTHPKLHGLKPGVRVEYEVRLGPTILCHSPQVEDKLPSATLMQVLTGGGE